MELREDAGMREPCRFLVVATVHVISCRGKEREECSCNDRENGETHVESIQWERLRVGSSQADAQKQKMGRVTFKLGERPNVKLSTSAYLLG